MTLWLDDVRQCPSDDWVHVHNYKEFVNWIEVHGLPEVIYFDHDLGNGKSGYDCAKWLVGYCFNRQLKFPKYFMQSMNPVGKENISGVIESYNRFYNSNFLKEEK